MGTVSVDPACVNCGAYIDPDYLEPIPVRGLSGGICERCDTELSHAKVIFNCGECGRLTHQDHRAGPDLCDDEECEEARREGTAYQHGLRAAAAGAYGAAKSGVCRGRSEG